MIHVYLFVVNYFTAVIENEINRVDLFLRHIRLIFVQFLFLDVGQYSCVYINVCKKHTLNQALHWLNDLKNIYCIVGWEGVNELSSDSCHTLLDVI